MLSQDNYEDEEQEVENGEEVKEKESLPLIENLLTNTAENNDDGAQDTQPLLPGLDDETGSDEPNYETMDTITLLSSLNLQEQKLAAENCDTLLPNLN